MAKLRVAVTRVASIFINGASHRLEAVADWFANSNFVRILDGLGKIFVLGAILAFVLDLSDRQSSRSATAWELVTIKSEGNSGKVSSLEYLNSNFCPFPSIWKCRVWPFKKRQSLAHINLSEEVHGAPVYLAGVELNEAVINDSKLSGGNLSGAELVGTNFQGSKLCAVDFSNANISKADFSGAVLLGAILVDTNIEGTDFRGADLRGTTFIKSFVSGVSKMNDCNDFKKAKNWHLSTRSKELECGKPNMDADESLTEAYSNCALLELPDHLQRLIPECKELSSKMCRHRN